MTVRILAYLAGVIDSDGYIGIKRSTYAMRKRKDSQQPTFSERVCVKQVEPQAVALLERTFGGTKYWSKSSLPRGRGLYVWQVTDRKAAEVLARLLPFLQIKRSQAKSCLALRRLKELSKRSRMAKGRGHVGAASRPSHISQRMERLYVFAKELNKVGAR